MNTHVHEDLATREGDDNAVGAELIGKNNGALNGFCLGIAVYYTDQYGEPGVHDDQEGFYVLEGTGKVKMGNEEFEVWPGSAFLARKGVPHTIKRNPGSVPVKVVWSHGAV